LTLVMNDDSNIEYNNIFPQILSKNRKITVNVSLEKMPERRAAFGGSGIGLTGHDAQRMGGEMYYDLNYNQIEKKTIAAMISGKKNKKVSQRNSNMVLSHNLKDMKPGLGFATA